ncbi:MAG: hypothetical protein LBK76_08665 [Verrucomicrobiales bacterium]|jgi:Skp family chaperone for outer membrane proteins|nr:hypothetical protein [Verrucomicrobiales bacterium]
MENVENFMVIDLVIVGAVVGVLMLALALWNSRRKPPIEAEFATNARVDEVERRIEEKIENLREQMRSDGEMRNENIFRRVNEISQNLQNQINAANKEFRNEIIRLLTEKKI